MIVFANLKNNVWAVGEKGRFGPVPEGQGDAYVAASGLPLQRVEEKLFNALREIFLHQHPNQVYADVSTNKWFVVGPGVYFEIPAGQGGKYEALYGSRHAVSGSELNDIRKLNGV